MSTRMLPALVFLACAFITSFAIIQMRGSEEDEAFANFSQNSRRLARDVELRLANLTQLASTGAGLLNAGQNLGRDGWASYIAGLQTTGHGSGFQGLGVAFRVVPAREREFVARMRREGTPEFLIRPVPGGKSLPGETFPVTYLVPASVTNEREVGVDLGSVPVFASAIWLARDRGEPSFSGVMDTLNDDVSRPRLILFAPFYHGGRQEGINGRREAFAGVVLIALKGEGLLQPLVEQNGTYGMALRVTDLAQEKTIFDSHPGLNYADSRFFVQHKGSLGGRNWQLDFAATPELLASIPHRNSLLVGLVGTFGSLLLTGIVYHLATLRQRAEQRALEMTRDLRIKEIELLNHRDHLADLVEERTAELLAAKNAAELANQVKSGFLANMSHELRTPLHAVLSFARLGEERIRPSTDEKTNRYFQRIIEAGERLLALVSDLLDLSKIEAGRMQIDLQPGDLVQLLSEVAAEFDGVAEERGLHLQLPSPGMRAPVMVDAARFSQVLRNVISNAIKFSPDGGLVRILAESASMARGRRAEDMEAPVDAWRIQVIDEGVGIPEDELESVFDSFVQSSKTRTGAGGTGLGLTICREIMAAHRGSISARNGEQGGAVFEIIVPRHDPAHAGSGIPG